MGKNIESAIDENQQCDQSKLRLINERFNRRLDASAFGGVRELQIDHGLKVTSSTLLHKSFTDMCFCEKSQVCISYNTKLKAFFFFYFSKHKFKFELFLHCRSI